MKSKKISVIIVLVILVVVGVGVLLYLLLQSEIFLDNTREDESSQQQPTESGLDNKPETDDENTTTQSIDLQSPPLTDAPAFDSDNQ